MFSPRQRNSLMLIAIALLLAYNAYVMFYPKHCDTPSLEIGQNTFQLFVADTAASHARGLSGHAPLGTLEGMLFVFSNAGTKFFWMKEMNFPLDIVWLDGEWNVVGMFENLPPESYPQVFASPESTRYVLEVPAGTALAKGIATGSVARYTACDTGTR